MSKPKISPRSFFQMRGVGLLNQARQELLLIRIEQRDVVLMFGVAIAMNMALWLMRRFWFPFNPSIAWSGLLILCVNLVLALLFARKGHVFSQALSVTTVVAELLLIILIVRTGTAGSL